MSVAAVETALYNALAGDADLIAELGGTVIYKEEAPQTPGSKYVIIRGQGGGDENDSPHRTWNVIYGVMGVAQSQEAATAIDTKIDSALHNGSLSVSGWTHFWLAREGDINLVEEDAGGVARFHVGGLYRIRADKN